MVDIDYIFELIKSDNKQVIDKGITLARDVKHLDAFIKPCRYGSYTWEICASIICDRSDEELFPYLDELFCWIEDIRMPGAKIVFERLAVFKRTDQFMDRYSWKLYFAKKDNNQQFLDVLYNLPFIDQINKEIEILKMLDANRSEEEQEKGVMLACRYCSLDRLIHADVYLPNEDIRENRAKVLEKREDLDLTEYLDNILKWTRNMSAPEAKRLYNRLVHFKDKKKLDWFIEFIQLHDMKMIKSNKLWLNTLNELERSLHV